VIEIVPQWGDKGRRRIAVHVPKSGVTLEFDARGSCVSGCF
jgi:hypothetical protein